MSFDRLWILALAWLPLAWAAWQWRTASRRGALLLKAASLTAILLALSEPVLHTNDRKVALGVLIDTSASISQSDLERASRLASDIERARGRNWVRILPFARGTRSPDPTEIAKGWALKNTSGDAGRASDLEAAVRDALAMLPPGLVPRLALVSDGKENKGSMARAAWQAQQLGVPIDTFALAGRPEPKFRLESISIPAVVFAGERFPVDILLHAPTTGTATIEVEAEGRLIGKNPVALQRGLNPIRIHTSIRGDGAVDLAVNVRSGELGELRYDQAVTLRRPKILYLSQDPAGTEENLLATLKAGLFDIQQASEFPTRDLASYQLLVLNNWDIEGIAPARKEELEQFVKKGGGLLVIGGEKNVYAENKREDTPLDRALPAKLAPPRSPEGTVLVLILDKSSSMEGRKMDLARLAAIGVIDNLRATDLVGVLIFDNSHQWAVPIRRAEDRTLIKRLIAGVMADGGTQIAPALSEAYKRILPVNATYKHIVLLTDGISEEGDSLDLAKDAAQRRVTISTVGLGQDVNRAYLEKVAQFAGGKSYLLNDPSGLEKILLKDVMEHTGSTAIEKPLKALVLKQTDVLEGTGIDLAPPLRGYVKYIAKPTAEVILGIDRDDPLYSRWQYGLGRAAVFASDAKSRWAADWITWKGYDRFWANLLRDLLPRASAGEAVIEFDSANSELIVDYRLSREIEPPAKIPEIFVIGPNGFQKPVPVVKAAEGAYRGRVAIGQRQGLFRIRPLEESRAFPEIGYYRPEAELSDFGSNEALLRQVAQFTGGRFYEAKDWARPASVFDAGGRSVPGTLALWPGLLALAIVLNLAELLLRKWKGIFRAGPAA
jgi:uncharacterized membrane protein